MIKLMKMLGLLQVFQKLMMISDNGGLIQIKSMGEYLLGLKPMKY